MVAAARAGADKLWGTAFEAGEMPRAEVARSARWVEDCTGRGAFVERSHSLCTISLHFVQ